MKSESEHPVHQTAADGSTVPEETLRQRALALYRPPFRFVHGYIYDGASKMVADQGGFDGKMEDAMIARIRGWGRIGYMQDGEALQDEAGAIVAEALTAFWNRRSLPAAVDGDARDAVEELMALVYRYGAHMAEHPDDDVDGETQQLAAIRAWVAALAQDGKGVAGKLPSDEKAVHPVSASAATVPEGMVLVPVQSTPAIEAVIKEVAPRWFASSVWTSLLDAAAADQLNGGK